MTKKKYIILLTIAFIFCALILQKLIFTKKITLNESFCNNIFDDSYNEICHALFTKDFNKCKSIESLSKNDCYYMVSYLYKNLSEPFCNYLNNIFCFVALAEKTNNASFCKGYDTCYLNIAFNTKNKNNCEYLKFDKYFYNICIAYATKSRDECKNLVDEKYCKKIFPENVNDCQNDFFCISFLAKSKKDIKICEALKHEFQRIDCEMDIITDKEICKKYEGLAQDYCLLKYVFKSLLEKL
ncbi:MAG: hypothetical protein QXG91_00965 [Candidatus Aenigmatarchaeota archaeon]